MDATNDYLNDDFGQDIFVTGSEHIISKELEMPNFKNYTKNGKDMVSISDSQYYKGGRGGLRNVSEETLLNNTSKVGRAYRAQGFVKAIGPTITVVSGVYDGYQEYQNGAALPQDDRIINASVEGGLSIMSGLGIGVASNALGVLAAGKIGAMIGSAVPGLGTIIGFAAGVLLSIVYNFLINQSINGKTIKEWIKYGGKSSF